MILFPSLQDAFNEAQEVQASYNTHCSLVLFKLFFRTTIYSLGVNSRRELSENRDTVEVSKH